MDFDTSQFKTKTNPSDQVTTSPLSSSVPILLNTPHLNFPNIETARAELRAYFLNTYDCYESLFECLKNDDAYYKKPIPLRHPLIFYFGHTATFFINKLLLTQLIAARINPEFENIFAVGVDEMSWDDLDEHHYIWPSVQQVREYRHQVRLQILNTLDHASLELPITWEHPWWSIIMGIEHERIHLETSSVLIRQHQLHYVQQHPAWRVKVLTGTAPINHLIDVTEGLVTLNKQKEAHFYGWDNEYGKHQVQVATFKASQYLVSNQEFLTFVQADGYYKGEYWTDEGLAWLKFSQAKYPSSWQYQHKQWYLRTMLEMIPMPWDWPVEVNYHEAKAFCTWQSVQTGEHIRLPTEDEWYRLYEVTELNQHAACPTNANIQLKFATHPCPVDHFQQGDFFDVQGNVWQWTETSIYPFEGFTVHPIYDDFSTPTFDDRHNLIKGGSWISAGNETLHSARYAFRRHFFQHAGFRYVQSEHPIESYQSHYETDELVSQYLEFQYGAEYFNVGNFAERLVELARPYFKQRDCLKALDLGCATGRASFELAKDFSSVTGLDFSTRFIQHAVELAQGKTLRYTISTEGELVDYKACALKDLGLDLVANKVEFSQADACNLKAIFSDYDFILAANLIDRLHHPKDFLSQIHTRLNMGGILMLSSPYTWLEEHTARTDWLGGFKQSGESFTTLDGIQALLKAHFELIEAPQDLEFVIRETARKYQHSIAQVTLWRRIH